MTKTDDAFSLFIVNLAGKPEIDLKKKAEVKKIDLKLLDEWIF